MKLFEEMGNEGRTVARFEGTGEVMPSTVLTAIRSKVKEGRYKGMNVTHIYKDNSLYAVFPPESKQPRYNSTIITLNCFNWKLNWLKS